MSNSKDQPQAPRRKFLKGAAAAATGATALGFPMIVKSQSPIVIKMQGSWGSADIFNDMAQAYVKRVNEMSGGRLRIDYLLAGAVVKPFEVMDAVSRGVLDGGHTVPGTGTASRRWPHCSARARSTAATHSRRLPGSTTAAAWSCTASCCRSSA